MNGRRFPRMDRLYERIRDVYLTADLRSLSAGRIVLALVLLRDLFGRWAELGLWYTNDGIIPNHTMLWRPPWDHVFSLFYLASYTHEAVIGFIICLFAFLALLIGFRTKLAQIASLICMLSLHGRTLLFDNGGDVVLGLLVWWTTFLPTGRHFSVDAVLARRRAAAPEAAATPPTAAPAAKTWVSLAVLAVIGQLAICYFFNAIHKQGLELAQRQRGQLRDPSGSAGDLVRGLASPLDVAHLRARAHLQRARHRGDVPLLLLPRSRCATAAAWRWSWWSVCTWASPPA